MTPTTFPTRVPLRFALHLPTLLPLLPWVVVIAALGSTPQFQPSVFGIWLLIHATTLAGAGAVGWAFIRVLEHAGKTALTLWLVLFTGALIGLIKALATFVVEAFIFGNFAPTQALVARGLGGVVVGMWVVGLVAYGKTVLAGLQDAREALIRQNVAHRLVQETAMTAPEAAASLEAVSMLHRRLARHTDRVSPAEIRDVVDSTIRPLSRAMWAAENKRYPELRFFSLYRVALQSLKIRALRIAAVWSITSFTALAVPLGVPDAALYATTVGVVAFAVFSAVRLGWTTSVAVSVFVVGLASLGSVSLGLVLFQTLFDRGLDALGVAAVITGSVWMVFVVLGSSIISGVRELRDLINHDLSSNTTQDLIHERVSAEATTTSTRLFAQKLHGSVQSSLLALANALERGHVSVGDVEKRLAAISEQLEQVFRGVQAAPSETIDELIASWRGLLDVVIDSASKKSLESVYQGNQEAHDIVREALTNAHRHGGATAVWIHANYLPTGDLTMTVTDNGYGPRKGRPGLGTVLLNTWTNHRWSLRPGVDGGSVLDVALTPPGASVSNPQ